MEDKKFIIGDVVYLNSDLRRVIPMAITEIGKDENDLDFITAVYWHEMQLAELTISPACLRR